MPLFHVKGVPVSSVAILLALVASIGGFIFGYDIGQISDIVLMDDFKLRFATCTDPSNAASCTFSVVRLGLIVSLLSIGTFVGALLGAPTADKLGRRYAMVTECMLFIVGVIVQITSHTAWAQVAVGRLISGVAIGALSAAVPMYQAETAPARLRGALTATYQLFITFGILVAYLISIASRNATGGGSWRIVMGIGIIWPCLLSAGILFMPESPRWLTKTNRVEKAELSVARTLGITKDDESAWKIVRLEVEDMMVQVRAEQENQGGWLDCFKPRRKILYRTLLGMALQSFQQLTGANYFFYYGATIFTSVGIKDSFITQVILGAVNFGCTFGGLYVMYRYGRRRPLIIGGIWQAIWLFVFSAVGTAKDPTQNPQVGTLMIVCACLFILGFSTTWAPGIWILIGETFPTKTRAKQGAIATSCNWLWNFLIAFFTPFITSSIHFSYGFVFAGCNLAGALVVYFFLYESSDLSLEAVDDMYNDPKCKPWTSQRWVPPGYASRGDLSAQQTAAQKDRLRELEAAAAAAGKSSTDVGSRDMEKKENAGEVTRTSASDTDVERGN